VLDNFEAISRPKTVRSIDERMLWQFPTGMRKKRGRGGETVAPYTIKVQLAYLRIALKWAVDNKMLGQVPVLPEVKVPKKLPKPVSQESFDRLLAQAGDDTQMRAYLLCGWLGGMRLGEAIELEREPSDGFPWVDWGRNRIWFPAEFVKGTADQWVPLDPQLRAALEALPVNGAKFFRFNRKDGKPISFTTVSWRIAKLARQAGVKLTMKTLRKGFGCYYAGEVPAQVLQKLMRHANISTTMDFYANVDEAVEDAVVNRSARNTSRNSEVSKPPQRGNGQAGSADSETTSCE
jgi:integrase